MKKWLLFITVLLCKALGAQSIDNSAGSSVVVHKDPRVDLLVKKQASINAATLKSYGYTMKGYRLLVLNTNKRNDAIEAKTKLYQNFPELKAYLVYQAPFFRLKVGNFKTRDEAQKYQTQLKSLFPKGVFILNDTIEVRPEKTDTDE